MAIKFWVDIVSGIYWSSALGLISLCSDETTRITVTDKNLGATTTDITSTDSVGNLYQWGNNYGFPYLGTVTYSTSQADASGYGPGNYYSSSVFRQRSSSPYYWDSSQNTNLWGGGGDENYIATQGPSGLYYDNGNDRTLRKGPCDEGYHIPSLGELSMLIYNWYKIRYNAEPTLSNNLYSFSNDAAKVSQFNSDFNVPRGYRESYGGGVNTYGFIQSSTSLGTASGAIRVGQNGIQAHTDRPSFGMPIRPFKNEPIIPDDTWTIIYQPS